MKKVFIFGFVILMCQSTLAQQLIASKLSYKDSLAVSKALYSFKNALSKKDIFLLRSFSLRTVQCDLFDQEPIPSSNYNPFISINTFLKQFYHGFPNTKLWMAITTKNCHLSVEVIENFHPKNIQFLNKRDLVIYEIWYVVWEPNEIAKGHEGASDAFEFIKVGKRFKFYGMTSIP